MPILRTIRTQQLAKLTTTGVMFLMLINHASIIFPYLVEVVIIKLRHSHNANNTKLVENICT